MILKKSIIAIVIISFATDFLYAQSPGYLNKKMSAGLNVKVSAKSFNSKEGIVKLNYSPEFNYFYSTKKIFVVQFNYSQMQAILPNHVYNDMNLSIESSKATSSEIGFNIGIKHFFSNIAPVGSYFSVRAGMSYLQLPYRKLNVTANADGTNSITITSEKDSKIAPQLIVAFGKQRVYFKRFIFENCIGTNLGFIWMDKTNTWYSRYKFSNIFYLQLGGTFLF